MFEESVQVRESKSPIPSYQKQLTRRELEILRLLAEGFSDKDLCGKLSITERTVQYHVRNITNKLNAKNRAHSAAIAIRAGII